MGSRALPRRRHRRSSIVLLTAAVVACGDSTGPKSEVTLSFCEGTSWAGIQNEAQEWFTIADGPGSVSIDASERVTVAVIRGAGDPTLEFYYLDRDQAQATFVCPATATKELTGSVAGQVGFSEISLGVSRSGAGILFPSFTLSNVLDGSLDLVAANNNRAIIRRGVNYPNGATIPLLDFVSSESFALQAHTLTIVPNGVVGLQWTTGLMTARGTQGLLAGSTLPCCTDLSIYTLPASRQESGDLYRLVVSGGSASDARRVEHFYATPGDQTVTFGPPANRATITPVTTPGQIWRAEITAQPEYGSQIELVAIRPQPTGGTTTTVIRASKEYFGGTPTTWTFVVPNLTSVAGFPATWQTATPGAWEFFASDAPWLFSPSAARAGDVYRSAFSN